MSKNGQKAYRQRSIVLTLGLILLGIGVLIAGAGIGVRFGLPDTWDRGVAWAQDKVDRPLLDLFRKLSVQYVSEAPDLEPDAREAWKSRLNRMASALQGEQGTADLRQELRDLYDGIADRMRDGNLTGAELAPFEDGVDRVLEQIDTAETKKKE